MLKIKLMRLLLATSIISVMLSACAGTKNVQDSVPSCITDMITKFKSEIRQNPPRSITQYSWNGRKVYYVTSPCCDQFNVVYDSACNVLGSPDGGFTGKGDGKLPGFADKATDAKLIWKDER
jgi:hypothetical protein